MDNGRHYVGLVTPSESGNFISSPIAAGRAYQTGARQYSVVMILSNQHIGKSSWHWIRKAFNIHVSTVLAVRRQNRLVDTYLGSSGVFRISERGPIRSPPLPSPLPSLPFHPCP